MAAVALGAEEFHQADPGSFAHPIVATSARTVAVVAIRCFRSCRGTVCIVVSYSDKLNRQLAHSIRSPCRSKRGVCVARHDRSIELYGLVPRPAFDTAANRGIARPVSNR